VTFAFVLAACGSSDDTPRPAAIAPVSGGDQIASTGANLPAPLVVQVTSATQAPVANAHVNWSVISGSGTLDEVTTTTDATGRTQSDLTLGLTAGVVVVAATVTGTTLSTQFTETAQTMASGDCAAAAGATPDVGSVNLSIQTTGLCLSGGVSGGDYALVSFNTASSQGTSASVTVTASGVTALATAARRPAELVPIQLAGGLQAAIGRGQRIDYRLETRLRERAAPIMRQRAAAARAWMRQRSSGALRDAIPATVHVGDLLRLNANEDDPCSNPDIHTGRVAAVTKLAIVVADTSNPPGGFSDADYRSFGAQFDTLIYPLDTANFGAPTDIDHNGRALIFFTRTVNELNAPNSGSIIDGFFFPRDLLPASQCAGSNIGEMFYMLVPDPNGVVNGRQFSMDDVSQNTVATLAHEFQHLINAARRLYVNNAPPEAVNEVTWLNEGLSHIAEELLFYHESGLAPRQNLDLATLQQQQRYVDAFNLAENANRTRYEAYLGSPEASSVYADDDELNNRGAVWGFLRWAADHRGSSDGDTWRLLVNSTTTGMANLRNVFGADAEDQIRDYATSLVADDVPSVAEPRALQPSWNWRSILVFFDGVYPLRVHPLGSGATQSATLDGGGSAYFRFQVAAGQTASLSWTSTTGGAVNWALVRTR
jgi:hypothetical protein